MNGFFLFEDMPLDEKAIEKYAENYRDACYKCKASEKIYYAAIEDFVKHKLFKANIRHGMKIVMNFRGGQETVIFEKARNNRIYYRDITLKGEPYKALNYTSWTMWAHISPLGKS